ncbi:regulator of nonsense transcripts 3B isoform X1 [Diorhabda sublineata]|uniref:regulator of nonsense transcripts 3B isoform X1 n=1 Tax=Diorhabda sublineata TaxID=1163346 RepID=UPI0024E111F3|nr:regulator of nonsense transcripts 3B isoform X1 [Diorhabda sublineata]
MALTESEKKPDKREKPLTKIIIRRLPPTIDQDTFLKQVSPIPDYNYIYIVNGDFSLGENAFSRVYINFVNHEDVYNFKERFDGYVFLDAKGNEYSCVVEFAAFQKIPKKRGKARMDPKAGSIESDPYYLDFVENLKKPQELDEKPEYTLQLNSTENKNDITTPLLEFIKNKRSQRMRIREVRREERKRREFDKRREHYDDRDSRKKVLDEKSPTKRPFHKQDTVKNDKPESETTLEEKPEKEEKHYEKSYYKNKDRRFDDRRFEDKRKELKPRFPRKEYSDYKSEERKERKFDYPKKEFEAKTFPKKVKKYSEKREERKLEAQKAEQKKVDEAKVEENKCYENSSKSIENTTPKTTEKPTKSNDKDKKDNEKLKSTDATFPKDAEGDGRKKDEVTHNEQKSDLHNQRRIRNKDRPSLAIYRPGMLSKRKQNETDSSENKEKVEDK